MSTVKDIIKNCEKLGIKPPSGLKKAELLEFYDNLVYALDNNLSTEASSEYKIPYKEFRKKLVPKYVDKSMHWVEHIYKYGWATVEIPNFDAKKYVDAFFSTLEGCTYKNSGEKTLFNRDDPNTWDNLPQNLHGIFKNNFGHFGWQWEIREKCIPVFEELWDTEDLLCSFDGACYITPGKSMNGSWLHCDQGRFSRDFVCSQGVVNLIESGPNDGGLIVLEGSNNIFSDYLDRHPLFGFSWAKIDISDPLVENLPLVKVCCPAGHIMLFDSRTFHCNTPPDAKANLRMVTYVSMMPKSYALPEELRKRKEAFEKLRMTSHWAYGSFFSVNAENPRSWGKDYLVPSEKLPVLTEKMKALV